MRGLFGMTRDYYLLLVGYFISSIGNWLYQLALPLLVYELTNSPLSMAVTYGLAYLPYILFLPIGGVIADRVNRQRLLVVGDFISALICGLLALAVWQGVSDMWIIYPAVFILAGVTPLYHSAFQSIVPSIVDKSHLARANSWIQSSENIVTLVGPLLGGVLIAFIGTTSALFIDGLSFLACALLIAAIRIKAPEAGTQSRPKTSIAQDMREGFTFVWSHPVLRIGSLIFIGVNFGLTLIRGNYVYFLSGILKATPAELGLAFAIPGIGAIAGSLLAPTLLKRFQVGPLVLGYTVLIGIMTLPLLVARDVISIALPWAAVTGFASAIAVTWFTLRQQVAPQHLLGRVVAITRLIAFIPIPIAAVVGGLILSMTQNMQLVIGIAAIVNLLAGGLGYLTPLYRKRPGQTPDIAVEDQEAVAAK